MLLGLVLGIGRGAHGGERIVMLARGEQQPGIGDLPLDVDLLRPVGVLGVAQLVAQLGELGEVRPGGFRLARPRGAEGAREMRDRVGVGNWLGRSAKFVAAFQSVRSTAWRAELAASAKGPDGRL